ncbi:MAG: Ig-like domain-containing protein, partial [Fibrobacteraceae bacterium]
MNERLSLPLLLCLLFVGCASVEAPKGGPEDKYPPRVAGVYPAPNSVEAPLELNVHLQFDEWIAASVPRSAVSISPPLEKKLKFEVDGDELFITSKARLDSNTTYTLTIASGLKDLHGNSVADPFRLTFSTGKGIDSLSVSGTVLVTASMIKQKQYPSIGLFLLGKEARATRHYLEKYKDTTGVIPDSVPRLTTEPPLFITQSDSLGRFRLGGLRPGRYRVVSFLDVNGNQKIEPSAEWAGLAESDILLDSLFKDTLWIPLADQDTSLVNLESVTQVGKSALSAKFSRNLVVDSALTSKGNCKLSTPDSSKIYPSKI